MALPSSAQTALVYDWVTKFGGAERVLLSLADIFPGAPLYTSLYSASGRTGWAKEFEVKPSWLNKVGFLKNNHRYAGPLMPLAFESLDLRAKKLVVSVSSWAAKGVMTGPKTLHLHYCLTPTRFLWSGRADYQKQPGFGGLATKLGLKLTRPYLEKWDRLASTRPDFWLAISKTVAGRIKKYYGCSAEVVYPPVRTDLFKLADKPAGEDWLVVSRLEPYKRVDLVIEVFNRLQKPLVVVGTGSQAAKLARLAGPTVRLIGCVSDQKLVSYYHSSQAVICPQEEDFGLTALEAQSTGRPVLAFGQGGFTETVLAGKTGEFFARQQADNLARAVVQFQPAKYQAKACRQQALRFSQKKFINSFRKKVEGAWATYQTSS